MARALFFSGLVAVNLSCSVNVLSTFADHNTDEAYLEDAKMLVNDGDYAGALGKISLIKGSLAVDRATITLKASAHAGICGLRFLSFVKALGAMGTTRLFPFLLTQFKGATSAKVDACQTASNLMESIGTTSQRTSDENMFLVLISFAKIGNLLSLYADSNQNGIPDNAADVGAAYNACVETPRASRPTTPVAGDWFTNDLRWLGSGITLAITNISAVSSTVDLGDAALTAVSSACANLATLNPAYNFCAVTDPTAFTATQLKGIKSILKEDSVVGLGTDCSGAITTCNCP